MASLLDRELLRQLGIGLQLDHLGYVERRIRCIVEKSFDSLRRLHVRYCRFQRPHNGSNCFAALHQPGGLQFGHCIAHGETADGETFAKVQFLGKYATKRVDFFR